MEQKQLDELDTYTEEFIEDETPEEHMVLKARRERKALAMKRLAERAAKEAAEKEQLVKTTKQTAKMKMTEVKMEPIKVETYTDDEIMITPVKEELKFVKTAPPVEVSTPVNPWATEEKKNEPGLETGFFEDVSTWQAFTGILIILLIFSIFTQGFQLKEELKFVKTAPPVEVSTPVNPWATETKDESGSETGFFEDVSTWQAFTGILIILLIFSIFTQGFQFEVEGADVNAGAELKNAGDAAAVVAVDGVESATTMPVTDSSEVSSAKTEGVVPAVADTKTGSSSDVKSDLVNDGNTSSTTNVTKSDTTATESTVSEAPATSTVKTVPRQVSLGAKKWRFSSEKVTVKQNDHVLLTIRPESLEFTFAIEELGVEKVVSGTTVIEFDALEKGMFEFSCSSCEEWRGMTGTLVVE